MTDSLRKRKSTDDALPHTGDTYHNLLSGAGVGLFRCQTSDGKLLECNERFAHMLGYETVSECLAGYSASQHYLDPGIHKQMLTLAKTTSNSNMDVQISDRHGSASWVRVSVRFDQERDCVDAVVIDITKEKSAEEAVHDSERRYHLFTDNVRDILCTLDMDLRFTFVSPSVEHVLSYTVEEALPMTIDQYLTPASVEVALQALSEELEIEKGLSVDLQRSRTLELELIHKDGSIIWTEVKFSFLRDDNSQPIGILGVARDVTERKRAEEALRESEEKYKTVVNSAPESIVIVNVDGTIRSCNPATEVLTGYKADELEGKHLSELMPIDPSEMPRVMQFFEDVMLGKDVDTFEMENIRKDGTRFWTSANVRLLRSGEDIAGILVISRDLTERRNMEESLRKSEEGYRLVAENITDVIWTMDMNLRLTYVSPAIIHQSGRTAEEAIAAPMEELFPPDSLAIVREAMAEEFAIECTGQGDPYRSRRVEVEALRKDGSTVWVEITASFLRSSEGQPIGILGLTRDITERKQTEEAVRVKEEYYRRLIENAPDGFVVLDADGKLLLSSPSADRIFGYDPGELVGVPVLEMTHPGDMARVTDLFNRLLLNPGVTEMIQVQAHRKDGSWCPVEATATNYTQDPAIGGVVINLRDITERKEAEEAIRFKEQYYRRLIENAPDGFVVANAEGSLLLTSSSAQRILGYTHQEMQGLSVFSLVHPDDVAMATDIFNRLLLNPGTTESSELRCHHKDGSWRHIETKATNYVHDPAVGGIVINLRDITDRKHAEERLQDMAARDYVTGLWNHREFHARLAAEIARARRANHNTSLLFMDIDNFKSVNEAFGHRGGDQILSTFGKFLQEVVRASDIAARYGGDEFTVVLPGADANEAYSLASRIQKGFKDLCQAEDKLKSLVPSLNLSIGIASYPEHATEGEELASRANQAMFYAKSLGGNRSAIWNTTEEFEDHSERLHPFPGHASLNMAMAMATAADARDPYTVGHSHRVGDLAYHIAMELDLKEAAGQMIKIAGLLHDVGKIAIPDRLLKKRRGLTKREREIVRGHAALGATMLKGMEFVKDNIDAVAGHHENWDGTGYPWGIAHEDIALGARIIRVADTFDAMTTDRRYGKRANEEQALTEIESLSGKWFDPDVVSALKAVISRQMEQDSTEAELPSSFTPSS